VSSGRPAEEQPAPQIARAAARIADRALHGSVPSHRQVFEFAAATQAAIRLGDVAAVALARELSAAIASDLPPGPDYDVCSGRLWGIRLMAWLAMQNGKASGGP